MEVAAFILSIFALIFALIGVGLSMRALYIIGVNAGLDKKFDANPVTRKKEVSQAFKKPIRTEGNKIIYNEDPLVYVIEDFISDEECINFVNASNTKLQRAKTIGGKDGIYHENR